MFMRKTYIVPVLWGKAIGFMCMYHNMFTGLNTCLFLARVVFCGKGTVWRG